MNYTYKFIFFLIFLINSIFCLYPSESSTRSKISLNGLWKFKSDINNEGFANNWFQKDFKYDLDDVREISVPSSYNEIYTNRTIKDHIGWSWYNRQFYINNAITSQISSYSVSLRIASCHYYCTVWINGVELGSHESGHLPFEFELTNFINNTQQNSFNLVVAVNNTLTPHTIPPARLTYGNDSNLYPPNYVQQTLQMDFYNYAGIHRDVVIYVKPLYYIQNVLIKTDFSIDESGVPIGTVSYQVSHNCPVNASFSAILKDKNNNKITAGSNQNDILSVPYPKLWWPRGSVKANGSYGYLYSLDFSMTCNKTGDFIIDNYEMSVGIRSVNWSGSPSDIPSFTINNEPFYCKGVNKHEDFAVIGRGIDFAILLKDVYLLDWLNINCMRTSHYPYAEEFLYMTDILGIAVIDEVPAVGLTQPENFNPITLNLHKNLLKELFDRDNHHASVIMWSLANEPGTEIPASNPYFQQVFQTMKEIDDSRPRTMTISKSLADDLCGNFSDIISINRYYGWYAGTGRLDIIQYQLRFDIQNWHNKYKKPLIVTEYGAENFAGVHCFPEKLFCEEYQLSLLTESHKVFDYHRNNSVLFGELVWNFADFMTDQDITRVNSNRKGMFTREREPKASAFLLKNRYAALDNEH